MRRKRLILSVALGVLAAGVIFFLLRGPSEPVYEGQKLGYWIRKTLSSADTNAELQAERAVKAAGTNALPYLLDQLTRPPPRWTRTLNKVGERLKLYSLAETERERINVAVFGLSALEPDEVASTLPALAKLLANPRRAMPAARMMCRCGDRAYPYFREAIQSTNAAIVLQAGSQNVLDADGKAYPLIEKLLSDPDSEVRRKTVVALGQLAFTFESVDLIARLIRGLQDTEPEVQIAATMALGKQYAVQLAVPTLLTLMTNSNARLAQAASNAFQRIKPSAIPSHSSPP